MDNRTEVLAGTDPTDWGSLLVLDQGPKPDDLAAADLTPIGDDEHAVYIRSVPGKTYAVQWADTVNGLRHVDEVITATTTQKNIYRHLLRSLEPCMPVTGPTRRN